MGSVPRLNGCVKNSGKTQIYTPYRRDAKSPERKSSPGFFILWWRCRELNPGHYGYELSNGLPSLTDNSETINLIKELLQHDEQRVNDSLRLILGVMAREWNGKREGIGENGPDPSSSETVPSPVSKESE